MKLHLFRTLEQDGTWFLLLCALLGVFNFVLINVHNRPFANPLWQIGEVLKFFKNGEEAAGYIYTLEHWPGFTKHLIVDGLYDKSSRDHYAGLHSLNIFED